MSFVARLSERLSQPPALHAWLERLNDWLSRQAAISPGHLADAARDPGPAATEQTPYLMIEVAPQPGGATYHIYCYWQDSRGEQQPLEVEEKEVGLSAIPHILTTTLDAITGPRPHLEFFLPEVLLTDHDVLEHWEQWVPGPPATDPEEPPRRPLGIEYPLSVRCRERVREKEKHK